MFEASIDLAAALETLTKKQRLNDVHFTIRLVREALRRGATEIAITLKRKRFSITHNAPSLTQEEQERLLIVTRSDADTNEREAALFQIEREGNLALLSALYAQPRAQLLCAFGIESENGVLEKVSGPKDKNTFVVETKIPVRKAKKELAFYCHATQAHFTVNRRPLKPKRRLDPVIASILEENEELTLKVGLPKKRASGKTRFYKHGIYYGVRQSTQSNGRLCSSWADSKLLIVEDNFRQSIAISEEALRSQSAKLYESLAKDFGALQDAQKESVKHAFLRVVPSSWSNAMKEAPLFDSGDSAFSRSLSSIKNEAKSNGQVLYSPHAERDAYLVLSAQELEVLKRIVKAPFRKTVAPSSARRMRREARIEQAPISIASLSSALISLKQSLDSDDFELVFAPERDLYRQNAKCRVLISPDDPALKTIFSLVEASRLDSARYLLVAQLLSL